MTELANVDFNVGGATYRIRGAKYIYNDADIRGIIGGKLTQESDLDDRLVIDQPQTYKRVLFKIRLKLVRDGVLTGNAAQSDNSRTVDIYCDPEFGEEALTKLAGRNIDENLLPGQWKITKAYVPLRRVYV